MGNRKHDAMSSLQKQTVVTLSITILFYSASVTCKHRLCHACILGHVQRSALAAADDTGASAADSQRCDVSLDANCMPEDSCADSECSCICHISVALFESHMYSPKSGKYIDYEDLFRNPVSGFANRLERPPSVHAG